MKTLLVYYSMNGNTKWAAEKIAEEIDTDILRLQTLKKPARLGLVRFLCGILQSLTKRKPKLQPYVLTPEKYDLIILATPVWASGFAPAMRSFLDKHDLSGKKVAILTCSMSGHARKCLKKLRKAAGNPSVIEVLNLVEPKKKSNSENEEKILDFCGRISDVKLQNMKKS